MSIRSDCNYSGQWVRECVKTLDSLRIPPCGHMARKSRAMVKVFASCQPDQEATEPCYSIEGVRVQSDGLITSCSRQLTHQKSMNFDSTKLVCCRAPDSSCPMTTFQYLTWENRVQGSTSVQLVQRREGDRDMWYYILLHRAGYAFCKEFQLQYQRNPTLRLSDWGCILDSGEGVSPPQAAQDKVRICAF